MKKFLALILVFAFAICGCATPMDNTQKGTLIGTGVGAAVGAGLGQAIGRDSTATLIGAAAGALAGGIAGHAIGSYMDRQEQEMRQSLANVEAASIRREQDILAVTFKADVLFDTGSATLKPGAYDEMSRVARVLNNYPQTIVRVEGHTDGIGSDASNQILSERRAEAVKNALIAQNVDPRRIETIGFGKSKPIATNNTEAGRQLNRRVTIVIIPVEG